MDLVKLVLPGWSLSLKSWLWDLPLHLFHQHLMPLQQWDLTKIVQVYLLCKGAGCVGDRIYGGGALDYCVNCGLFSRFNPVHCEVTPSNVTLVLLTELAPVGTNGPSADTFVPVTEYCQPVL